MKIDHLGSALAYVAKFLLDPDQRGKRSVSINPDTGEWQRTGYSIPIRGTQVRCNPEIIDHLLIERWLVQAIQQIKVTVPDMRDHTNGRGYTLNVPTDLVIMVRWVGFYCYFSLALLRTTNPGDEAREQRAPGYLDNAANRWVPAREYGDYAMDDEPRIGDVLTDGSGVPL